MSVDVFRALRGPLELIWRTAGLHGPQRRRLSSFYGPSARRFVDKRGECPSEVYGINVRLPLSTSPIICKLRKDKPLRCRSLVSNFRRNNEETVLFALVC